MSSSSSSKPPGDLLPPICDSSPGESSRGFLNGGCRPKPLAPPKLFLPCARETDRVHLSDGPRGRPPGCPPGDSSSSSSSLSIAFEQADCDTRRFGASLLEPAAAGAGMTLLSSSLLLDRIPPSSPVPLAPLLEAVRFLNEIGDDAFCRIPTGGDCESWIGGEVLNSVGVEGERGSKSVTTCLGAAEDDMASESPWERTVGERRTW
jgi:hypothetical protein